MNIMMWLPENPILLKVVLVMTCVIMSGPFGWGQSRSSAKPPAQPSYLVTTDWIKVHLSELNDGDPFPRLEFVSMDGCQFVMNEHYYIKYISRELDGTVRIPLEDVSEVTLDDRNGSRAISIRTRHPIQIPYPQIQDNTSVIKYTASLGTTIWFENHYDYDREQFAARMTAAILRAATLCQKAPAPNKEPF
jgi:hypothetical protein